MSPEEGWKRLVWVFENHPESRARTITFQWAGLTTGRLWLAAPQVELGRVATPYAPPLADGAARAQVCAPCGTGCPPGRARVGCGDGAPGACEWASHLALMGNPDWNRRNEHRFPECAANGATHSAQRVAARYVGDAGCTPDAPCAAGEGDCDGDATCNPGLVCIDDIGAQYGMSATYGVCVETDAGLTRADYTSATSWICLHFARGDCIYGKDAARDVYPVVSDFLDRTA